MDRKVVAVVESDAEIRKLIRMTLDFGPYEMCEAVDADAGWEMILSRSPRLILLSARLAGGIDGGEFRQRLKADLRLRRSPVVMLLDPGQGSGREAEPGRGDGVLIKPFSPLDLVDVVEMLVERRS